MASLRKVGYILKMETKGLLLGLLDTVLGNDLVYARIKDPAERTKYRQDRINEYMGMLGGQGGEQPAPQGGQPAPAGAPITSKAEYDKLPSGAHYVAPNGKTYVKG